MILITRVIPSDGRGVELSLGPAYCVDALYIVLFHQWGASCGFRVVRFWDLWRAASIYLGMETSMVLLV